MAGRAVIPPNKGPGSPSAAARGEMDVSLVEVGPRDGLQSEPRPIDAADKIALIDALADAGCRRIEAASFVSPRWVPQMMDSDKVMAGIRRRPGVRYSALVPNLQGYERARSAGVDEIAVFASASEEFSQRNSNASIAEVLARAGDIAAAAQRDAVPMRGYISCAISCPYSGPTESRAVVEVAEKLIELGCFEISLADTIGVGTPAEVGAMLDAVLEVAPAHQLAGHYHDTQGRALQNIEASLEKGLGVFDTAAGGLGGCPYAPGANGNVASGKVLSWLHSHGLRTGIDEELLAAAEKRATALISSPRTLSA